MYSDFAQFIKLLRYERKVTLNIMGEIRGNIANDAEEKFRQLAMKKFGYGKGSLSKALEEALNTWIKIHENETQ